jgi:hypothetical protein
MYLVLSVFLGGLEQAFRLICVGKYHRGIRKNDAIERLLSKRIDDDIKKAY